MVIHFNDRFNRKFLKDYKFLKNKIGYDQLGKEFVNRDNLPASLWLDGDIYWCNTKMDWHCTTGPNFSYLDGNLVYSLNGKEMSKMEWLIAIE